MKQVETQSGGWVRRASSPPTMTAIISTASSMNAALVKDEPTCFAVPFKQA